MTEVGKFTDLGRSKNPNASEIREVKRKFENYRLIYGETIKPDFYRDALSMQERLLRITL